MHKSPSFLKNDEATIQFAKEQLQFISNELKQKGTTTNYDVHDKEEPDSENSLQEVANSYLGEISFKNPQDKSNDPSGTTIDPKEKSHVKNIKGQLRKEFKMGGTDILNETTPEQVESIEEFVNFDLVVSDLSNPLLVGNAVNNSVLHFQNVGFKPHFKQQYNVAQSLREKLLKANPMIPRIKVWKPFEESLDNLDVINRETKLKDTEDWFRLS